MTYVIAEIGSNFRSFEEARDSISIAASCGVDAVKFQCARYAELYGPKELDPQEWKLNIYDWLPDLAKKAKVSGVDFLCTAFSVEGLRVIDEHVVAHKIAGSDLGYVQLLQAARETGKHVYLSSGGSHHQDIEIALNVLDPKNTTLMYCYSEYPSTYHDLRFIDEFRNSYNVPIGYSDHSIDCFTPFVAATVYGAICIEKHFRAFENMATPDEPHSINPTRMRHLCRSLRSPDVLIRSYEGEQDMFAKHNRRLVATAPLNTGDSLAYGVNFGAYRVRDPDVKGCRPHLADEVTGRRAAVPFNPGDTIGVGEYT